LAAALSLFLTLPLGAQSADKPKTGDNVQGTVQSLDKANMHMTIANLNVKKEVHYSSATRFRYGHSKDNKPGSVDQIKVDYFVSCSGSYEPGNTQLQAKECVYREAK